MGDLSFTGFVDRLNMSGFKRLDETRDKKHEQYYEECMNIGGNWVLKIYPNRKNTKDTWLSLKEIVDREIKRFE